MAANTTALQPGLARYPPSELEKRMRKILVVVFGDEDEHKRKR